MEEGSSAGSIGRPGTNGILRQLIATRCVSLNPRSTVASPTVTTSGLSARDVRKNSAGRAPDGTVTIMNRPSRLLRPHNVALLGLGVLLVVIGLVLGLGTDRNAGKIVFGCGLLCGGGFVILFGVAVQRHTRRNPASAAEWTADGLRAPGSSRDDHSK